MTKRTGGEMLHRRKGRGKTESKSTSTINVDLSFGGEPLNK